jgi:hypothetical protein
MQEYQQDAYWTNKLHTYKIPAEGARAQGAAVGILIANKLLWHIITNKQACKETSHRQENLSGNKVEEVEHRLAKQLQTIVSAKRQ